MPIESKIVPDQRLVLTKSWGKVSFEEIFANWNRLLADPEFDPEYDELGIHIDAESFTGTNEQAVDIGRRKVFSRTSLLAYVAGSDHIYGLLRMMTTYHELEHKLQLPVSQVFRNEESARQWLVEMRAKRETTSSE